MQRIVKNAGRFTSSFLKSHHPSFFVSIILYKTIVLFLGLKGSQFEMPTSPYNHKTVFMVVRAPSIYDDASQDIHD